MEKHEALARSLKPELAVDLDCTFLLNLTANLYILYPSTQTPPIRSAVYYDKKEKEDADEDENDGEDEDDGEEDKDGGDEED